MITLRHYRQELELTHTFRLARGASDVRQTLVLELEHEGLVGLGEAAPIDRYDQDCASAARAAEAMAQHLTSPLAYDSAASSVAVPGEVAAEAAMDMAVCDLAGKKLGVPLYELMGIDPRQAPVTSFTIGMDTPEVVEAKVREAGEYEVLKIKMGSDEDRQILEAVRGVTDRPLRVDANEGWTLEGAQSRLEWLESMGVELVEQPLPAGQLEEMRELRRLSPLPLFADESVYRAADIPRLAGAFDGINIKLMKCGGLGEARRMIAVARAHGMQVMLGCMVESSLAITAAAHLSPLVDFADLDGNLLITDDPFVGATVKGGRLVLPEEPGLGVRPRAE
ncbi:MAG: dipeptide epimerase [Thermoanaerobaculia bacterium]|jgi:L-alanine-DL-glutamate epimerase-like enolase superfamily enzyme